MHQSLFDEKDNENDIKFDQLSNAIKDANNLISDEKCNHQQLINLMNQDYDNKTALNNFNFMNKLAENDKKTFEMNQNLTSKIKTLDNIIYGTEKSNIYLKHNTDILKNDLSLYK